VWGRCGKMRTSGTRGIRFTTRPSSEYFPSSASDPRDSFDNELGTVDFFEEGREPMRIVWHSNWVRAPTGYGKQTRHVVCRLDQLGHDIYVSANYGLHGRPLEVDGVVHLPGLLGGRASVHGALFMHVKELKPDLVCTLMDV